MITLFPKVNSLALPCGVVNTDQAQGPLAHPYVLEAFIFYMFLLAARHGADFVATPDFSKPP